MYVASFRFPRPFPIIIPGIGRLPLLLDRFKRKSHSAQVELEFFLSLQRGQHYRRKTKLICDSFIHTGYSSSSPRSSTCFRQQDCHRALRRRPSRPASDDGSDFISSASIVLESPLWRMVICRSSVIVDSATPSIATEDEIRSEVCTARPFLSLGLCRGISLTDCPLRLQPTERGNCLHTAMSEVSPFGRAPSR